MLELRCLRGIGGAKRWGRLLLAEPVSGELGSRHDGSGEGESAGRAVVEADDDALDAEPVESFEEVRRGGCAAESGDVLDVVGGSWWTSMTPSTG
jgi:hypothetical protein